MEQAARLSGVQRARQAHGAGRATHDGSACRPPAGSGRVRVPSQVRLAHFECSFAFRPAAVHPLRPDADRPLTVGVGELIAETALHRVELKRVLAFGLTTRRHLSTRAAAGQARASSVRISFKRCCGKHGFRT
jgi:hypothetical protein